MPETAKTPIDRSGLVEKWVTELTLLAKERCRDAAVEVAFTRHEDEDAHIFVFVPQGTKQTDLDTLQEVLTDRCIQILLESGLLILAGVYEAGPRDRIGTKPKTNG